MLQQRTQTWPYLAAATITAAAGYALVAAPFALVPIALVLSALLPSAAATRAATPQPGGTARATPVP